MLNSKFRFSLVLLLTSLSSFAMPPTPEGEWAARSPNISERPIGVVKISIVKNRLSGELIEVLPLNGSLRGCYKNKQTRVGPVVMCNYYQSGDKWIGGYIFESKTAKIYESEISLSQDGNELYVTGISGVFSQTATWTRLK